MGNREGNTLNIGNRILHFKGRMKAGDLANGAGISQSFLSRVISGESENPSIKSMMGIAKTLGLTVSQLLGEGQDDICEKQESESFQCLEDLNRLKNLASEKLEETKERDWTNPVRAAMEDALAIAQIRSEIDFLIRQKQNNIDADTKDSRVAN